MSKTRQALAWLLLSAIWGTAFMAIKAGLGPFGDTPVLFAAFRYDLAGILMLGYAIVATDQWRPESRAGWIVVLVGGAFMIAGYHAFLFVGELNTTSAVAAVVVSLSPILTTGFARVLLPGRALSRLGTVGLFLGLLGVVVIAQPDPAALLGSGIGEFLVFLAAVSFALGSVLATAVDAALPIETMEAWSMVLGAIMLHGISAGLGERLDAVVWSGEALLALGYLSVVASAIGFLIYFDLLDRLGPVEINLVSYLAPIWAALTGWLVLDESVSAATAVGFAIIVAGFWLIKREAIGRALGDRLPALGRDR
ncbi:DMT family transporter [Halodesulfurarchaeum sp. HSR-GB]|uniref:DMT family transporter n=1 Tax=Halodesulfurarchaeum sp. HSR-GB TaxID=3074077 RepID=UPI0028557918|nr:DMT family transporter [Halodesulfurarchaeum sp. HSR-GB]MDR5655693.1 DMT family transporter [Halodesulfurarchaeum sp. HSR-GB]